MIERTRPKRSVGAQCRLLAISRSSFHHAPRGETAMDLDLMLLIDKQFLQTPFCGVRQMTWHVQNDAHAVNHKRIRRLMRPMRLTPIYQKPDTSRPAKGHKTYPYLLGGLRVERPNQVWCADISCLTMRKGFLCLLAWGAGLPARAGIGRWIVCNNHHRPHPAHGGQPPAVVTFDATQTDQKMQPVA